MWCCCIKKVSLLFLLLNSTDFVLFFVFCVWLMIILLFVMLLRAKTSFSQNGGWSRFSFVFMLIALPISLKWSPCLCLVQQCGRRDVSLQRFISIQRSCNKRSKIHNKALRQWWLFCVVPLYQEGFSIVTAIWFSQVFIVLGSVRALFKRRPIEFLLSWC